MKVYLKYELKSRIGTICQSDGDVIIVNGKNLPVELLELESILSKNDKEHFSLYIICGSYQDINIWNLHTKEKVFNEF